MKYKVKIPKSRLYAPIDYGEVISSRRAMDVKLEYEEYAFMQTDGKVVLFDAYSASHSYAPLEVECGVIAFPFRLSCATDSGERVAYCGLRFSEERATEWRLVANDEAKAALAIDKDAAAVPISSGVCCFSGADAYAVYRSHLKDDSPPLSGLIVLDGQTHTEVGLFGKKYAVFSTGWGDGRYNCYVGISADGKPTAVIVDFGMIDYPKPHSNEQVEIEVEVVSGDNAFIYDPSKSESENNVLRYTVALEAATDHIARLHAYSRRGYAHHSLNNIDAALADYLSAIEECRSVKDRGELLRAWSVYDNAADIFVKKGDYDSAIKLMTTALDVGDNFYVGVYVRLIDLYLLTKRSDKAEEIAYRMVKNRSGDPVAFKKYAEVCVAEMDYKKAAKAYDRLAVGFGYLDNLFDEAACLIELGDYTAATEALESHPAKEASEQFWYYKAYIEYKNRRFVSALNLAKKSREIDPEYMPTLYLLIDIHSILQEYHAVARYAEEYIKIRPDNEYGYSVCAEAHLILGNFSESSRNYGYLYESIKSDDKYAALAAMTAAKIGDMSRKRKLLRILRRKRSPYYGAAIFAIYSTRHRNDAKTSKIVYKLKADDDFMLHLAVYMTDTDNFLPATHILDKFLKNNSSSSEVAALRVRTAAKLGDNRLFDRLFGYYVDNYAGELTKAERAILAERFKSFGSSRHAPKIAVRREIRESLENAGITVKSEREEKAKNAVTPKNRDDIT